MRDSRVDDYLATLPAWQREAAQRVRLLLHEADPELSETIKRTRQPYFVLDGNVAAFLGTKNHLNVFIYDPIAPDPTGLINQGHGNATARSIQIFEGDQPDETALLALVRAVIANNRAGGWRKLAT
ncbi:DUF1801 domain-containing protein [Micropruina glycogenica]|jgi:hypothetical protein|uniref:YdhG-like domain-containing protein n=1 Tax=Micropruina glycogenica TaxID=75385 RepID=A0A2N9J9X6_9ACTN|nr:DUF1801 domain-containing protein [Micropruina glycogenica]SPD85042.1 conserved protein of unknown function [Micropruina glycogenica]